MKIKEKRISLSVLMTGLVVCIVLAACIIGVSVFTYFYVDSMQENAITNSEQAVSQVAKMVTNYTEDMNAIMGMVRKSMEETEEERGEFFQNLIDIRKDVEAITVHSEQGELLAYWSDGQKIKQNVESNLSYILLEEEGVFISAPHVQNLFLNYYPWVVTFSQKIMTKEGEEIQVSMDIRFSSRSLSRYGYRY